MWIYKITNIINNKIYIGQTINNISLRFWTHKYISKYKHTYKSSLYNAMRKYGTDYFIIEVLMACSTREELNNKEIEYISICQSCNPKIGYNMTKGGTGGGIHNLSNKLEIYKKAALSRTGIKNGFYGKQHTEETKQKLRIIHTGKSHTEESKRKISESMKGREITWGDKISMSKQGEGNAMYGTHHTEEQKRIVSEKLKGVPKSPEHIQKLKDAWILRKAKKEKKDIIGE